MYSRLLQQIPIVEKADDLVRAAKIMFTEFQSQV